MLKQRLTGRQHYKYTEVDRAVGNKTQVTIIKDIVRGGERNAKHKTQTSSNYQKVRNITKWEFKGELTQ